MDRGKWIGISDRLEGHDEQDVGTPPCFTHAPKHWPDTQPKDGPEWACAVAAGSGRQGGFPEKLALNKCTL